jgi:hypothetical protein
LRHQGECKLDLIRPTPEWGMSEAVADADKHKVDAGHEPGGKLLAAIVALSGDAIVALLGEQTSRLESGRAATARALRARSNRKAGEGPDMPAAPASTAAETLQQMARGEGQGGPTPRKSKNAVELIKLLKEECERLANWKEREQGRGRQLASRPVRTCSVASNLI